MAGVWQFRWQDGYSLIMTGPTAFMYEGVFSPDGLRRHRLALSLTQMQMMFTDEQIIAFHRTHSF